MTMMSATRAPITAAIPGPTTGATAPTTAAMVPITVVTGAATAPFMGATTATAAGTTSWMVTDIETIPACIISLGVGMERAEAAMEVHRMGHHPMEDHPTAARPAAARPTGVHHPAVRPAAVRPMEVHRRMGARPTAARREEERVRGGCQAKGSAAAHLMLVQRQSAPTPRALLDRRSPECSGAACVACCVAVSLAAHE